ncbi:hypothetical protein [Pseudofrankia sp. BMG5.37]|uniref:hypothetical protein n=1 Tax=Pseudofrankia sp. BMG5.37 TaxID=3050035 RepID=UPI00289470D8|nr:hypothetical protein [Pseudofrankia sp. BMG5.37]MDT3444494.1 hypothetical protein [Pseudofrankia sp. BMG5.37]
MVINPGPRRQRFLVVHDYGMGGLWWWVQATSEREIVKRIAEVEVVTDADSWERAAAWNLPEVDLDAPDLPPGLDDLRQQRDEQRGQPGFGALAGRALVHLRCASDDEESVFYYWEVGEDGRRLREVEVHGDGPGARNTPDDWPFNTPVVDLYDPRAIAWEIDPEEFEAQWQRAGPNDDWAPGQRSRRRRQT